ncbi:MAG TPA: ion channel protein [Galbitalea sp.]|jgi:H+/Cl- antiporter ClcA
MTTPSDTPGDSRTPRDAPQPDVADAPPPIKTLLVLSIPAALIGVVCALVLFGLDKLAEWLQNVVWTDIPKATGIDPASGWWIFGVLTITGLAVGLALWLIPGHGGLDSATTELSAPPPALWVIPSIIVVVVLSLAGGVSLGPENPILAINAGLIVGILAKVWKKLPSQLVGLIATAGTVGALFGTPIAAALILTGIVAALKTGGALWDRLFLPLVAASVGAVVMDLLAHPVFALPLPAYTNIAALDLLSAVVIAISIAVVGVLAAWVFPLVHRTFRLLRNPVFYVTAGGVILGILGAIGGPITLFKGVVQMGQLVDERSSLTVEALIVIVLVKVVALLVSASSGFRGGRIFPSVFIGVAAGLLANLLVPSVPLTLAVGAGVLGMVLAVSRDGWIALFIAAAVTNNLVMFPVLCIAVLPCWLLVSHAPKFIVKPAREAEPLPT